MVNPQTAPGSLPDVAAAHEEPPSQLQLHPVQEHVSLGFSDCIYDGPYTTMHSALETENRWSSEWECDDFLEIVDFDPQKLSQLLEVDPAGLVPSLVSHLLCPPIFPFLLWKSHLMGPVHGLTLIRWRIPPEGRLSGARKVSTTRRASENSDDLGPGGKLVIPLERRGERKMGPLAPWNLPRPGLVRPSACCVIMYEINADSHQSTVLCLSVNYVKFMNLLFYLFVIILDCVPIYSPLHTHYLVIFFIIITYFIGVKFWHDSRVLVQLILFSGAIFGDFISMLFENVFLN